VLLGKEAHLSCDAEVGDTYEDYFLEHGVPGYLIDCFQFKSRGVGTQLFKVQETHLHHVRYVEVKDPVLFLFDQAQRASCDLHPAPEPLDFFQGVKADLQPLHFIGVVKSVRWLLLLLRKATMTSFGDKTLKLLHDGDQSREDWVCSQDDSSLQGEGFLHIVCNLRTLGDVQSLRTRGRWILL
jgi:hypothetical protein